MGEGHFSPDPLGSSNFRASKQLKTAKNGLFWQFLPIWHSVDQIFGWNHLDLNQKSLTIYWGRYFKSRSGWIQPYFGLKTAENGPKWPILVVLPISHSIDQFFDKNHHKYMGEGHLSLDPLGSSNVRASWQLKTGQDGLFWQFSSFWHSVDQFLVWNQLDLTQKSVTIEAYKNDIVRPRNVLEKRPKKRPRKQARYNLNCNSGYNAFSGCF